MLKKLQLLYWDTETFTSRIGGLGEEMEIMTEAFNQNQPQQTEAKLHLGLHLF